MYAQHEDRMDGAISDTSCSVQARRGKVCIAALDREVYAWTDAYGKGLSACGKGANYRWDGEASPSTNVQDCLSRI